MSIQSYVAAGNISPSRFVKYDSAVGKVVANATATTLPTGVSGEWTRNTPLTGYDDGYHAISGENCRVYCDNEECWLELGGTVTYGDKLIASTAGVGITSVTDKDAYGAIALQSGVSGQLIRVKVIRGYISAQ